MANIPPPSGPCVSGLAHSLGSLFSRAGLLPVGPLCVGLVLAACGGGSSEPGQADPSAGSAAGQGAEIGQGDSSSADADPRWQDSPAPLEGANSAGVLTVVDPEFPERPFYKQFGSVPFGKQEFWTFEMRNEGPEAVRILSGQEPCGCTKFIDLRITGADGAPIEDPDRPGRARMFTDLSREKPAVVPPGGTVAMRCKLITSYSRVNEQKLALMRLTTDSRERPYLTFEVGFKSTRSFIFAPERANLLNAPFSAGKSERIKILVDRAGDPERVIDILSTPEGIEAELVEEPFGGEPIWYVDVSVPPVSPRGPIRGSVVLRTTDTEGKGNEGRLELPVIAEVVPDVVPSPRLAAFRTFDLSQGASFTGRITALVPGARLRVLRARFENDLPELFSATLTPIKPFDDGTAIEWQYTAKLSPGHPEGYVSGEVIFELEEAIGGLREDAPQNEVRVRLSGVARPPAVAK
ncbi:MAG: hypothetical protein AAGG01_17580 [Planctomycetota bacterium]